MVPGRSAAAATAATAANDATAAIAATAAVVFYLNKVTPGYPRFPVYFLFTFSIYAFNARQHFNRQRPPAASYNMIVTSPHLSMMSSFNTGPSSASVDSTSSPGRSSMSPPQLIHDINSDQSNSPGSVAALETQTSIGGANGSSLIDVDVLNGNSMVIDPDSVRGLDVMMDNNGKPQQDNNNIPAAVAVAVAAAAVAAVAAAAAAAAAAAVAVAVAVAVAAAAVAAEVPLSPVIILHKKLTVIYFDGCFPVAEDLTKIYCCAAAAAVAAAAASADAAAT